MKKRQLDQHRWVLYSHSADLGGAELSLLELAKLAHSRGVETHVVLPRNGPIKKMLENAGIKRISIIPSHNWMTGKFPKLLGIPRLFLIWLEVTKISNYLKHVKPNLLIVNTSVIPGPIFAGNKCNIPTAVFVHEGIRSNKKLKSLLPKSWIVSLLKRKSDLLIVPSQSVGEEIGGDYKVFAPLISEPNQSIELMVELHQLGPKNPFQIVMLGRISQNKGHLDAIRAIKIASEKGLDVHFSLYGTFDSSIPQKVKDELESSSVKKIISVHPPQEDIDSIFAQADLTLVLSYYETYGKVATESVLRGVPVVGFDIPATRELLNTGGGEIVSDPVNGTVEVIEQMINDHSYYRQTVQTCRHQSKRIKSIQNKENLLNLLSSLAVAD